MPMTKSQPVKYILANVQQTLKNNSILGGNFFSNLLILVIIIDKTNAAIEMHNINTRTIKNKAKTKLFSIIMHTKKSPIPKTIGMICNTGVNFNNLLYL